jgi:hypothetical protein
LLLRQSIRPSDSANGGKRSAGRSRQRRFHVDLDVAVSHSED